MSDDWQFHGCTLREIYNSLGFLCQATLTNGKTFSGYIYSIDPETFTLLILQVPPTQAQEQEQSSEQTSISKHGSSGVINRDTEEHKSQDQEPTQTQAQVSPSKNQTSSNTTATMSASKQGGARPTMVAIRQHALKTFSIEGRLSTETMEALADLPVPPNISPVDIESRKQSIIAMLDSVNNESHGGRRHQQENKHKKERKAR
ncbi:hypothetical protein BGZ96_003936 [Linnemannia gamsii]|uniref:LSM domain-containing protein n=1 Tax=Linnemannia gamsii TaxID=64522 RepID=A0ABQ7KHQ0_9FUNG|nr:hypothetical protein BGZ96_003936 [Linnemannia gamsii]